jgi:PAS domain S-box-containing protein
MSETMIVVNLDTSIKAVNLATTQLLGFDEEEMIGTSINSFVRQNGKELFHKEMVQQIIRGEILQGIEVSYINRNKEEIPVLFSSSLMIDKEHKINGLVCIAQDISERREAQKELERQQKWLQGALTSISDAIITTDAKGNINYMNYVAEQLTGSQLETSRGVSIEYVFTIVDEKSKAIIKNPLLAVIENRFGGKRGNSGLLISNTDQQTPIDSSCAPILDKFGKTIGGVLVFRDISKRLEEERSLRRAKDEAEAADKAKSDFLATMSHEIRTPLNGVLGMTSLLLDSDLNAEQMELAEIVQLSGDHLLNIINDILDFSKIESGVLVLEETAIELKPLIEEITMLFTAKARQKKVELMGFVDPRVPPFIKCDPTRLRQILANLVNNAIKFTKVGDITIFVDFVAKKGDKVELQFSVKDSGIGIPEEQIERIFDAFTQAESSTNRKYGGTGLGLAISKKLANCMDGDMWVESSLGVGSTFYFTIKVSPARKKTRPYLKKNIPSLKGKKSFNCR